MDSLQVATVRSIAYRCPGGIATANAQSILQMIYNEDIPPCTGVIPKSLNIDIIAKETEKIKLNEPWLGNNTPNPLNKTTEIPYYLPEWAEDAHIAVSDITGKPIKKYLLPFNSNKVTISFDDLNNGVYFYSLIVNNITVSTKRMVIIK
ncbi:MAG: T9SS type A sorting domain-containing protein [Bacteroidia bacterium]|nr:T9SS type A sorting domain-containing protein [Bacteroidia bacterium]